METQSEWNTTAVSLESQDKENVKAAGDKRLALRCTRGSAQDQDNQETKQPEHKTVTIPELQKAVTTKTKRQPGPGAAHL
jgi:hypothetical protein